jgi:hypothetical protein
MSRKLKVLILCRYIANQGAVVVDSVNSFVDHSVNDVFVYSSAYTPFDHNFPYHEFDVIVVHYSIIPTLRGFISNRVTERISTSKAKKVMMAQDEYRSTSALVDFANKIRATLYYSVVPEASWSRLFENLNRECKLVPYLTGYVPTILCTYPVPPMVKRKWGIVYRGRKYPRWFGEIILKKIDLALELTKSKAFRGIRLNISVEEKDRVYGADWIELLSNSRTVFATESDVEIVDPDGRMLSYDLAVNQLLDKNEDELRDEIKFEATNQYTKAFPGSLAVIAPRIFEAIALRTVLLMPPGEYSGILQPWKHYIPLNPDFSNAQEVRNALLDTKLLVKIASTAYADICSTDQFSYKGFAESFDIEVGALEFPHLKKSDDSADISDAIEFFVDLQTKYPFYYMSNPHGLKFRTGFLKWLLSRFKETPVFRKIFLLVKTS